MENSNIKSTLRFSPKTWWLIIAEKGKLDFDSTSKNTQVMERKIIKFFAILLL